MTEALDDTDFMCPNCVTPWKCNGPHLNDQAPYALRERGDGRAAEALAQALARHFAGEATVEAHLRWVRGAVPDVLARLGESGWVLAREQDARDGEALRVPTDGSESVEVHVGDMVEARYWRLGKDWSDWHCWSGTVADTIAAARACLDERCDNCRDVDRALGLHDEATR